MTLPADVARCANARRCALDGVCLRSGWKEEPGWAGYGRGQRCPAERWFPFVAPPPTQRPSPHLCGWYLEER